MRDLGHTKIDLLKLDIEGAEYKVLDTLIEDNIAINVLCIEFDEYFHPIDEGYIARIDLYIERLLSRGYKLVHTSGNANYTFALENVV